MTNDYLDNTTRYCAALQQVLDCRSQLPSAGRLKPDLGGKRSDDMSKDLHVFSGRVFMLVHNKPYAIHKTLAEVFDFVAAFLICAENAEIVNVL